jgi:hypothetical protein
MRAALRRLALLFAGTGVGVGAGGLLIGLAAGASAQRSLSVAYYVVGAFLIVLGFFAGNRGPLRPKQSGEHEPVAALFGTGLAMRRVRRATVGDEADSLATATIFLCLGGWLIILGIVADASVDLL